MFSIRVGLASHISFQATISIMNIESLLGVIAALLFLILWKLQNIDSRLKDRFPTEKEQDHRLAMEDPHGHWEAHKDEFKKK